jgi:hypothetical protein
MKLLKNFRFICALFVMGSLSMFSCGNIDSDVVPPSNNDKVSNLTKEQREVFDYLIAHGFAIDNSKSPNSRLLSRQTITNLTEAQKAIEMKFSLENTNLESPIFQELTTNKGGRFANIIDCTAEGRYELRSIFEGLLSRMDYEFKRDANGQMIKASFKPVMHGTAIGWEFIQTDVDLDQSRNIVTVRGGMKLGLDVAGISLTTIENVIITIEIDTDQCRQRRVTYRWE